MTSRLRERETADNVTLKPMIMSTVIIVAVPPVMLTVTSTVNVTFYDVQAASANVRQRTTLR